jgi:hypothetical protein
MKQLPGSACSLAGRTSSVLWRARWLLCACAWLWSAQTQAAAPGAPAPKPKPTPQAQTPLGFDLPGYWVSIVTQNWRFRMVVPTRGDYAEIPLNLAAKQFADAWNPAPDEAAGKQCEAYGAAAIMRVPERLHISWQDPSTLAVQTDSGMQTRLLRFAPTAADAAAAASWQGYSVAHWELHQAPFGRPGGPGAGQPKREYGGMAVMTTHMLPGLLRKNGVPYSGKAQMSEYWEVNGEPEGDQWLTVTTELQDPEYLQTPFYFTSIFQKEPDGSKWDPTPCSLTQ